VNQDLHDANILSAERELWLAVDPKPLVGEREIDGVGLLRNAAWRGVTGDCLDLLEDLGYDRERSRAWGVAHALAWGHESRTGWSGEHLAAARAILAA
jgi:streptomycin 6-kinase